MNARSLTLASLALLGLGSCTSVQMVGYKDGWVKSSTIAYHFQAPPLLQEVHGQTYRVVIAGYEANGFRITEFESRGMEYATGDGDVDVTVRVQLDDVRQGEPGAMKLGGKYYPAFEVSVPYEVAFRGRDGAVLDGTSGTYSDHLTFKQFPGFESREEAVGALDTVRKLASEGVEETAYEGAYEEAGQRTSSAARTLFEDREISMMVPVVRTAAGLDLETPYTTLAEADGPDQVRRALSAYESLGTSQLNEDGTSNDTANYGVACGIAACRLMLRDLSGAWEACKAAAGFEPNGSEAEEIQRVIYEQEKVTGVRVIPDEDRAEIERYEGLAAGLEDLVRAFGD